MFAVNSSSLSANSSSLSANSSSLSANSISLSANSSSLSANSSSLSVNFSSLSANSSSLSAKYSLKSSSRRTISWRTVRQFAANSARIRANSLNVRRTTNVRRVREEFAGVRDRKKWRTFAELQRSSRRSRVCRV